MAAEIQSLTAQIQSSSENGSIEEELAKARSELAEKDLTIFNLRYQQSKDVEELQRQLAAAQKESEYNLAKCGTLKQEIRRLREPEAEDTIVIKPR